MIHGDYHNGNMFCDWGELWELFHDFFRLRIAQIASLHICRNLYPKDILIALDEPMLSYLECDKNPIDRMDEVRQVVAARLTPEQYQAIAKIMIG